MIIRNRNALSINDLIFIAGEKIVPLYMMLLDPKEAGKKSGESRNLVYSHAYHQFCTKLTNHIWDLVEKRGVEIMRDYVTEPLSAIKDVDVKLSQMAPGVRKTAAENVAKDYNLLYTFKDRKHVFRINGESSIKELEKYREEACKELRANTYKWKASFLGMIPSLVNVIEKIKTLEIDITKRHLFMFIKGDENMQHFGIKNILNLARPVTIEERGENVYQALSCVDLVMFFELEKREEGSIDMEFDRDSLTVTILQKSEARFTLGEIACKLDTAYKYCWYYCLQSDPYAVIHIVLSDDWLRKKVEQEKFYTQGEEKPGMCFFGGKIKL